MSSCPIWKRPLRQLPALLAAQDPSLEVSALTSIAVPQWLSQTLQDSGGGGEMPTKAANQKRNSFGNKKGCGLRLLEMANHFWGILFSVRYLEVLELQRLFPQREDRGAEGSSSLWCACVTPIMTTIAPSRSAVSLDCTPGAPPCKLLVLTRSLYWLRLSNFNLLKKQTQITTPWK